MTEETRRKGSSKPRKIAEQASVGSLSDHDLDGVSGGREPTKHPAKVTVPDIKISIS
jgi:hypothetical protein